MILFTMLGVSATGKGTRMSTLIEFLKTKYDYESILVQNIGTEHVKKPFQILLRFPELKLIFFGKWVRSNKTGRMISWSSLDGFSGYKEYYNYLAEKYNDHHYCSEGYFGAKQGDFHRPEVAKKLGFTKVVTDHFLHGSMENLQERCMGRSGASIKGSCYVDDKYFTTKPENQDRLIKTVNEQATAVGIENSYTFHDAKEDPWIWGCKVLGLIGHTELKAEFMAWAQENSTLRNVANAEANVKRFEMYLSGDTAKCVFVDLPVLQAN